MCPLSCDRHVCLKISVDNGGRFHSQTKSLHENTEGYYFRTDVNLSVIIYTSRSNRCKLVGDASCKDTLVVNLPES